jgi:hypothetical protein
LMWATQRTSRRNVGCLPGRSILRHSMRTTDQSWSNSQCNWWFLITQSRVGNI